MKLENQEAQSAERIRVAREKLRQQKEIANARLKKDNVKK
jgi:hypothetical protein